MKKINIVTGHYGSGKTNVSANLAVKAAESGKKVTVVDLDIVNPYFRTADFDDLFGEHNIELVKPMYANTNLDIPAISFDLERIAMSENTLIIDVGGDDDGAIALGRYAKAFEPFLDEIEFYYVVNYYRYPSDDFKEAVEMLYMIEQKSAMKATAVINNSNLGDETDEKTVLDAYEWGRNVAEELKLPLAFTVAPDFAKSKKLDEIAVYNSRYVKTIWEKDV